MSGSHPKGWYAIGAPSDFGDRPRKLMVFGRPLVAFRGPTDEVVVLDAHCPHLGADLSGGRVVDGALQCPFHGWRFGAAGRCVSIPGQSRIPERAHRPCWSVREHGPYVLVYFENGPAQPAYEPEALNMRVPTKMSGPSRTTMELKGDLRSFQENACDDAHFSLVHGSEHVAPSTMEIDGVNLISERTLVTRWFGLRFRSTVVTKLGGPSLATVSFSKPFRWTGLFSQTPMEAGQYKWRGAIYGPKILPGIDALLRWLLIGLLRYAMRGDLRVWSGQKGSDEPVLTPNDKQIVRFRKWFKQFEVPADLEPAHSAPKAPCARLDEAPPMR